MRVPYVIDSAAHRLGDILNGVLAEHHERALDVATAYFPLAASHRSDRARNRWAASA
jgi:hypothetical protein